MQGFASAPPSVAAVIDITFVDDDAMFIVAESAAQLDTNIEAFVRTIFMAFRKIGLTINFAKGKIELIISYHGKAAKLFKPALAETAAISMHDLQGQPHVNVWVHVFGVLERAHVCTISRY